MKKIIALILLSVSFLVAAESFVVNEIKFEGMKNTSPDFIFELIKLKKGDRWDISVKNKALSTIRSLNRLVLSADCREEVVNETEVNVTFVIEEKLSFILIPFLTYSNSSGIKPKVIFRHYNLGGWGKYLGMKVEFLPTENIGGMVEYVDSYFLNQKNLTFGATVAANTSYFNYQIRDIAPIGTVGTDWEKGEPWNEESATAAAVKANIGYLFPYSNITVNTALNLGYKIIHKTDDTDDNDNLRGQMQSFVPAFSFNMSVPVTDRFVFNTAAGYSYEIYDDHYAIPYHDYNQTPMDIRGERRYIHSPNMAVGVSFPFVEYGFTYSTNLSANYSYKDYKIKKDVKNYPLYQNYTETGLEFTLHNSFLKHFYTTQSVTNSFGLNNYIVQRALHYKDLDVLASGTGGINAWKDVRHTIKIGTTADYWFEYRPWGRNLFVSKFKLFYYYNDINTRTDEKPTDTKTIAEVEKAFYAVDSDYMMGVNTGDLKGYAGAMWNIGYKLPLFTFTTPSFLTYQVDKPLLWDAFIAFFVDVALAQNYDDDDPDFKNLCINRGKLHLMPGLGCGVRFEMVPQFVPAKVTVELGVDLYKIVKRGLTGNIVFVFGIDNQ